VKLLRTSKTKINFLLLFGFSVAPSPHSFN